MRRKNSGYEQLNARGAKWKKRTAITLTVLALIVAILFIVAGTKYPPIKTHNTQNAAPQEETNIPPENTAQPLFLNALQMLGTHNSYHRKPAVVFHRDHKYTHESIETQLRMGMRHFELDIHVASLNKYKFRVLHLQLFDDKTSCKNIHECIAPAHAWSLEKNKEHNPIVFMIEIKDKFAESIRTFATKGSRSTQLKKIEQEILNAWPSGGIITPQDTETTWPYPLQAAKGKAIFLLRTNKKHTKNLEIMHILPHVNINSLEKINEKKTHFITTETIKNQNDANKVKNLTERGVIVRMRIHKPHENPKRTKNMQWAEEAGVQLIATDHPPVEKKSCCIQRHTSTHTQFSNGKTVKIN